MPAFYRSNWSAQYFDIAKRHLRALAARKRVATMLLKSFQGDRTTAPWFLKTKAATNAK